MGSFIEKNSKYFLAAILLIAAVLIFTGLTRADIQHDDATYSFRSAGYLDFMNASVNQTTPLQWFEQEPWWSGLSFHDHPPLVFIIQFIFFSLLGQSVLIAKLPFALAGLGSVLALYFLGKELYGKRVGLLAAFLLSILSYHAWASKVGYLEGFSTLLILLTLLFLVKATGNKRYFYPFGILLGLTILTKYTVAFILPAMLVYLIFKKASVFKIKELYLAGIIVLIIVSPLIVYNYQMYQARGHFDLQLAILFGQDISEDWPVITRSVGGLQFNQLWLTFFRSYSVVVLGLAAAALIYTLGRVISNKTSPHLLAVSAILAGGLQFLIIGPEPRLMSVLNPFIVLLISAVLIEIYVALEKSGRKLDLKKSILFAVLAVAIGFELFYNINTNILHKPLGQQVKHYSQYRWETGGFNNLEGYLLGNELISYANPKEINSVSDVAVDVADVEGKDVFIYEPDLDWFSTLWYFARYSIYNDYLFISAAELANFIEPGQWTSFFAENGIRNMYYISGENDVVLATEDNRASSRALERGFSSLDPQPVEIYNDNNSLAFKIYKVKLN